MYIGLNLLNLEYEQGIAQLTALVEQGPIPSIPGNLILASMKAAQLEIGNVV